MRILIVSDSYPPETRSASHLMKDLADALHARGHEVAVVTTYPTHNLAGKEAVSFSESTTEDGIRVIRAKALAHHNVSFIAKGIAWLLLPYFFFRAVKRNIKEKIDVVIVHSPPLPLAWGAGYWVKRHYGARYLLNLHDIFPQNAVDLGVLRAKLAIRFFEWMERSAYARADKIVVPSGEHRSFVRNYRHIPEEKIAVVPHWIDVSEFESMSRTDKYRKQYGLEGKFIFLFGGVLGPSQGLDLVLRIADRVRDKKDVVFLFVGEGTEKPRLTRMAEEMKLENVRFEPLIPKSEYPLLVKDADVGIVCLTPKNTTPAVPAKLMGYMAGAIPVVAFLHKESEAIAIVRDARCGYAADSGDEDACVNAVMQIYAEREKAHEYGRRGYEYLLRHFTKEVCAEKWEALFRI